MSFQKGAASWKDVLTGAAAIHLPDKSTGQHEDCILRNELLTYLKEQNCGWTVFAKESCGTNFITTVTSALWYLDGHYNAIELGSGVQIPNVLLTRFQGFNVPKAHKHVKKRLDSKSLIHHIERLTTLCSRPYMQNESWPTVKVWLEQLVTALRGYVTYLDKQNESSKDRHASNEPLSTPAESTALYPLSVNPSLILTPSQDSDLCEIISVIKKSNDFEAINLNPLLPEDRWKRYRLVTFIRDKGFASFSACLFTYAPGGNVSNLYFLWKEPHDPVMPEADLQTMRAKNQASLLKEMPTYHTQQMRREFQEKANLICNLTPAQVRAIYKI